MKIMSAQSGMNNVNFRAAQVNILATSDNHGNVHSLPKFVKTIESNEAEIFQKGKDPSTLNIFAIAGDWFINPSKKGFITKSGFMLGLGETMDEIKELIFDLSKVNLDILTVGQYIRPSKQHLEVKKYYTLEEYKEIEEFIKKETTIYPIVAPLARSSYKAKEAYEAILAL